MIWLWWDQRGKEDKVKKKGRNKWLPHQVQPQCSYVLNLLSASITSSAVLLAFALQFQGFASVWGLKIEKLFQLLHYINQISSDLAHSRAGIFSSILTNTHQMLTLFSFFFFFLPQTKNKYRNAVIVHISQLKLLASIPKVKEIECLFLFLVLSFRARHSICGCLQNSKRCRKWDSRQRKWVLPPGKVPAFRFHCKFHHVTMGWIGWVRLRHFWCMYPCAVFNTSTINLALGPVRLS